MKVYAILLIVRKRQRKVDEWHMSEWHWYNGHCRFDTTIGGLQLSDQFLQIATRLNSHHLFGLGEHMHQSLEHDMNWTRWSMWTRDHPVTVC